MLHKCLLGLFNGAKPEPRITEEHGPSARLGCGLACIGLAPGLEEWEAYLYSYLGRYLRTCEVQYFGNYKVESHRDR